MTNFKEGVYQKEKSYNSNTAAPVFSNPAPISHRPSQKFTKEEIEVIRLNSKINGKGKII